MKGTGSVPKMKGQTGSNDAIDEWNDYTMVEFHFPKWQFRFNLLIMQ